MSLGLLEGSSYGPITGRIAAEKVGEYIAATGDDPERWSRVAPPSYAGALLFMAAPVFIHAPEVGAHTKVLVHSDQRFRWHQPLLIGTDIAVTGHVNRVRERGGLNFVTFDVAVDAAAGDRLLDSTSTFLMGSEAAAEPGPDQGEPPVDTGSVGCRFVAAAPESGSSLPSYELGASRLDLVHYAAASGDFNPIHFDHDAARAAGLDGVVVHGLLMAAWLARLAATTASGSAPLVEMKLRFRQALRPAVTAVASGLVKEITDAGEIRLDMGLSTGGSDLVTATATTAER